MHMYDNNGMSMGGWHWLWWLFWFVVVGGLLFYGWRRPQKQSHRPNETPHQILQRRLANGEMTTEDYEKCKELLDRDADGSV